MTNAGTKLLSNDNDLIHLKEIIEHDLDDENQSVAIFGHNPTFTYFAQHFDSRHKVADMVTCSVVMITSTAEDWNGVVPSNSVVTGYWFPKGLI